MPTQAEIEAADWKITREIAAPDLPQMSDAELKLVQERLAHLMDLEFKKAFGFVAIWPDVINPSGPSCGCRGIIHTCNRIT